MKDLIIIGAGPAGLGASIYASRYKLNHVVIGDEIGGQVVEASEIENYAGFESISGKDLMDKFKKQTEDLGAKIVQANVEKVNKKDDYFEIYASNGKTYEARSVIFALGMKPRKMGIEGEDKFIGKGISYCATCDAMFFRDKDVAVIGGGDAAAMATTHLSEFANKIYLIYKEGGLVWNPAREDEVENNPKVEMVSCNNVVEIKGSEKVEGIVYNCNKSGEDKEIPVQGVFVEIGSVPGITVAKELGVKVDDKNFIEVDQTQATNVENVYAAGDVTTGSNKFRQIITAVAEGAVAAGSIYKKLKVDKK